jgi:hypothetical protein
MGKPLWGRGGNKFADTEPASTLPMMLPEEEQAYAPTAPSPLIRAAALSPAIGQQQTLHELMALIRKDNRVCPQPHRWSDFYALLENFADGAPLPSPPLVGAAWNATPSLSKRMCFREQVEWAASHDCVTAAITFLKGLKPQEWHYMG